MVAHIDKLDEIDKKLIGLMVAGKSNAQMSAMLKIPLSTVQRRTRILEKSGYLITTRQFNYARYGYKTGILHIYLTNGDARTVAEKILNLRYISCVSIHIGNSDIVAKYACKDNESLLRLLSEIKHVHGVKQIVWSEQVLELKDPNRSLEF